MLWSYLKFVLCDSSQLALNSFENKTLQWKCCLLVRILQFRVVESCTWRNRRTWDQTIVTDDSFRWRPFTNNLIQNWIIAQVSQFSDLRVFGCIKKASIAEERRKHGQMETEGGLIVGIEKTQHTLCMYNCRWCAHSEKFCTGRVKAVNNFAADVHLWPVIASLPRA